MEQKKEKLRAVQGWATPASESQQGYWRVIVKTGRKQTDCTNDWAKFGVASCYTENAEATLTWSAGGWGLVWSAGVGAWMRRNVPVFLEEAGSASGFGLELRLSKRVVRTQSWGWLGIRQKHWAEQELASGRVQGWDYTACEKSRKQQWVWEGPPENKVRTAQQLCCKSSLQYFWWRVIAGSSLMFFNWSEGNALANKKSSRTPGRKGH